MSTAGWISLTVIGAWVWLALALGFASWFGRRITAVREREETLAYLRTIPSRRHPKAVSGVTSIRAHLAGEERRPW